MFITFRENTCTLCVLKPNFVCQCMEILTQNSKIWLDLTKKCLKQCFDVFEAKIILNIVLKAFKIMLTLPHNDINISWFFHFSILWSCDSCMKWYYLINLWYKDFNSIKFVNYFIVYLMFPTLRCIHIFWILFLFSWLLESFVWSFVGKKMNFSIKKGDSW